jgi:regulator of nonsense transcripts 2
VREVVELSPMESWIQHLMHNVLVKRTIDKVLKYLRKLHWEDPEVSLSIRPLWRKLIHQVYIYLLKTFTNVWELKYGNIGFVAGLVYDLQRYHPDFGVTVLDQTMENIRIGMEVSDCFRIYECANVQENIFKFNQRRLACVKYLGELYMYRAVSAAVIFDTLWSLISFGHRKLLVP